MEQWEIIKNNPQFQYAIGPQVTGDPNQWWNKLPQDMKDSFINLYGDPSAPVLNQQTQNEVGPALTGYEDYSVSDYINEATGENAANRVSQEDYNVDMTTGVLGTDNFNTRSDANFANMDPETLQQLADAGNPTAQAMLRANVRQPYAGPVLLPEINVNAPANVPDVDYSDPTLVPMMKAGEGSLSAAESTANPVLIDTTKPNNETSTGVLDTSGGPSVRSIMSSSGPKTSNMRGSDMPNMLIDRNEALIRIGGRMYGGALQGDGISAATDEYGKIQDANRKTAMEKYKQDQAQKLAMAKAASKGKTSDDINKAINDTNMQMDSYQRALNAIYESRASGGNLTGIGGMAKALVDNFTGDEDAARRLLLKKVKVDDALLRVANTKGAISNAEMKLFLSPAPKDWQDEKVWESWIIQRMEALQNVQARLRNGQEVPEDMKGPNPAEIRASSEDGQYTVELFSE